MSYKIGMIIGSLIGGGTQKIVETLANTMSDLGHEVVIFTLKGEVEIPASLRARVVPLLGRSLAKKRREVIAAIKQGGEVGPLDLMLTHGYEGYRLMDCVAVNCYHVVHNAYEERVLSELRNAKIFSFLRKYLKYRYVFRNKKLITVSQGIAQGLERNLGVRPENVQTIYNPFIVDHVRALGSESAVLPAAQYILAVGALVRIKRQDLLLRAYARMQTTARLVLMGEGPLKNQMIGLANELGIANRVDFLPWQHNPYPYIKHAKLLVLIEALILGTPVVSTDCPHGPSEILTGELARFLVPRNDASALAAAMADALANPPHITDAMVGKFDHRFAVERYLDLIKAQ
jgi:glycosyltransferase involved in cell wall biosynthesis